jgi:hypothetical protein
MYQLTNSAHIMRLHDNARIPEDMANADYVAYVAWVEAGNEPLPAYVPPFSLQKAAQFASFNTDRVNYLDALMGMAGRASRKGDDVTADACDRVAEGLLVLKDQPEVLAATSLPALQSAMLYCYAKLLVGVPSTVKAVFNKVKS